MKKAAPAAFVFILLLLAGAGAAAAAAKPSADGGEPDTDEPPPEPEPEPEPDPQVGGFDTVEPTEPPGVDLDPAEPSPPGASLNPVASGLDAWITPEPTQGRFYQVIQQDNAANVTRRALGTNSGNPRNCPFIKSLIKVTLNRALYSKFHADSAAGWPKQCALQTTIGLLTIGQAFLPRNPDVAADIAAGISPPVRAAEDPGTFTGNYALLWIPFEDGQGELEPPPEIQALFPTVYA